VVGLAVIVCMGGRNQKLKRREGGTEGRRKGGKEGREGGKEGGKGYLDNVGDVFLHP